LYFTDNTSKSVKYDKFDQSQAYIKYDSISPLESENKQEIEYATIKEANFKGIKNKKPRLYIDLYCDTIIKPYNVKYIEYISEKEYYLKFPVKYNCLKNNNTEDISKVIKKPKSCVDCEIKKRTE